MRDLNDVVAELRAAGGDSTAVEVKSGAGGFPKSVTESLCALANLPGGGLVIIGLDEGNGFQPVSLPDPQGYLQKLGNVARNLTPPAHLAVAVVEFEGHQLVVAEVAECDPSQKPCRVNASNRSYLRSHDGDYALSDLEVQAFLRMRTAPVADQDWVTGSTADDLDDDLVRSWRAAVRQRDPNGIGRFSDEDMLLKAGVLSREGSVSKAGLLALGVYPQQYFPRLVVQVADMRSVDPQRRARNIASFGGAIPTMLSSAVGWVTDNAGTVTVETANGSVQERPTYPAVAVREVVANALVHRDLEAWSEGQAVELRLRPGRLALINPGGLYGVTVDKLGVIDVTSARNQRLVALCMNVIDPSGTRVIEALASGLTTVSRTLADAGLPAARYYDTGINFTAILDAEPSVPRPSAARPIRVPANGTNRRKVFDSLVAHPGQTVREIAAMTGLNEEAVRNAVRSLSSPTWGLIDARGGRGKATTYRAIGGTHSSYPSGSVSTS